jgi:hypothetical protein
MDTQLHSGLTIAGISQDDTHPTVINYHKFGKKYWDDTQTNGSQIGYYFAYYFQKRFVYIHKIIDIISQRPTCMDWASDRKILCLSEQLKAFTWDVWVNGPGRNAPYTSNYRMLPTSAWSYSDLQKHNKFSSFNFIHFKNSIEKGQTLPNHSIEEDTEGVDELAEEQRILLEQLKANQTKQAQRKALRQIEQLRSVRGLVIANQIHVIQKKLQEIVEQLDGLEKEKLAVERGERDNELISEFVAKACETQIRTNSDPRPVV